MGITLGLPNKRNVAAKVDKFEGKAIMSMHPYDPETKKKTFRFELSPAALEMLDATDPEQAHFVSFGYSKDDENSEEQIVLFNTTSLKDLETSVRRKIYQNGTFTTAEHFKYIEASLDLNLASGDEGEEVHFNLTEVAKLQVDEGVEIEGFILQRVTEDAQQTQEAENSQEMTEDHQESEKLPEETTFS